MYIGSITNEGVFQLFKEIVDNSIDELINGYGRLIKITIINDQTICVSDNGRGVPIGLNKTQKKKNIYLIFEHLHAGGKFNSENYQISSGLHGVGAAVVNALSSQFLVYTIHERVPYLVKYNKGGKRIKELSEVRRSTLPKSANILLNSGTAVQFTYDKTIFKGDIKYDFEEIKKYCEEKAYLCSKLRFELNDERTGNRVAISFANELSDFLASLSKSYQKIIKKDIQFTELIDDITVKITFNYYSDLYTTEIRSFANYIATPNGGTHNQGFRQALTKCFLSYIKQNGLLTAGSVMPNTSDILQGVIAVVLVMIPEKDMIFEGQTKTKLATPIIKNIINRSTSDRLMNFLNLNKHTSITIVKQILQNQKARVTAKKARAAVYSDKNARLNKVLLAGKLVKCFSHKSSECELFLVEGDSAGGTAKRARSRQNQAILPLKGKILNTYGMSIEAILKNKEVNSLITTLECGFGKYFNYEKLRFHKIIIMTDADTDGAHIRTLIITLFWSHFLPLIQNGHLYIANAPLFRAHFVQKGTTINKYFWTEQDLNNWLEKQKKYKCYVQRYKGLGEMNAEQLRVTTMDPKKRILLQVQINDHARARKEIDILMGGNAELRKVWISKNVNFTLIEK